MDDDTCLLSSSSSVTSVTCSSKKSQVLGTKKRLDSGSSFIRRSSSPSLVSTSSKIDENLTNRTSDSVSSSNSSVFIEEKPTIHNNRLEQNKLIKSLHGNSEHINSNMSNMSNSVVSRHRSCYSDDYDNSEFSQNSICNLSKIKIKQEKEVNFLNLIHECQTWIEIISNTKFSYPNDFRKSLENGVILCELLNVLKKNCVRRINRHSTPIAGIDNLNVFLKACVEHFKLIQSDLFDITDLEDLNRRRGSDELIISPTLNCIYSPNESKESENLGSTTSSTEKLNCKLNQTDYLADEEQKRRLKKVINTLNWLSRKAIELGIQIPYHFDINNPTNHSINSSKNSLKNNNFQNAKTCSYNSVSSTSSSSSSYCSSFSNSSLNQYSTSSSLSSSSSFSVSNLPPQIPLGSSKISTPKSFISNTQGSHQKRHSTQNSFKNLDDGHSGNIDENNSGPIKHQPVNYTMSYIYKQQQSNLNGGKLATSLVNRRSAGPLQIDPNPLSSSNTSSSSSSTSSDYNPNMQTNNNNLDDKDSHDELQLIDSTMSPISSTNSAAVSPRLTISTSSSSNNISNSNSNQNLHNIPNNTVIPTRYIDRRVSNVVVEQKFINKNYSEAGQLMARKAAEQLEKVEKSKEQKKKEVIHNFNGSSAIPKNGPSLLQAALAYNKKSLQPPKPKSNFSGSGGGSVNGSDEWQNSVDDWKKRRREKKNLPAPRTSLSIDFDEEEESREQRARSERRRINRFEQSVHYLSPPGERQLNKTRDDIQNNNEVENNLEDQKHEESEHEIRNKIKLINTKAATIELSGINDKNNLKNEPVSKNNNNNSILNESLNNNMDEMDNDNSMLCTDLKYIFLEKFIEIERPYDHVSRGFGFLLNSSVSNKEINSLKKLNDENINLILSQNYAQIVVVENESLADKAGLRKGDLVTQINDTMTSNLPNEQLRKTMRQRLQLNSIQLHLLTLETSDSVPSPNKEQIQQNDSTEITKLNSNNITNPTSTTQLNVQNSKTEKIGLKTHQNNISSTQLRPQTIDIIAPKPYKKSTSSTTLIPNQPALQNGDQKIELRTTKMENISNDDTDYDTNSDIDDIIDDFKNPPPVPATAPPPLPKFTKNNISNDESPMVPKKDQEKTQEIKKVLLDNMKSVENWKTEQELFMKRKYEEGQKKIEISLKLDLEKVKEEENQRREQERLKLEKEKIRLQELELKQKEQELLDTAELKSKENKLAENKAGKKLDEESVHSESVNVRNEDLNALIEKLYTEETDEKDALTDYKSELDTSAKSDFAEANLTCNSSSFQSSKSNKSGAQVVMTKTSPIVAAALSFDEEEDFDMFEKDLTKKSTAVLMKNDEKQPVSMHTIIKHVHDSMDILNTELLQKSLPSSKSNDTDALINRKLKDAKKMEDAKKLEEAENLKIEQKSLIREKEKIEKEKEKLRLEAEELRIERELILMAKNSKQASITIAATSNGNSNSSSTSSTSSTNDQLESEFNSMVSNEHSLALDNYKILNQFSGPKSIPIVFPAASSGVPQNHKYSNSLKNNSYMNNYQNIQHIQAQSIQNPQHWLIEEAERQRNARRSNPNPPSNDLRSHSMRRSVPNLLVESNTPQVVHSNNQNIISNGSRDGFDYTSMNGSYNNNNYPVNSSYINPSVSSSAITRIYQKQKKSDRHTQQKYQQQQVSAPRNQNSQMNYSAKPPTSSHPRQMSSSQSDLKNLNKHNHIYQKSVSSPSSSQNYQSSSHSHKLSTSTSSILSPLENGPCPIISLNQKCSSCTHMLGQGSAMFIEKLGLAFHLKCFRCNVCNIPLGNGKEGTDVRVSVTNRLHCNNCFSNDLGVRLSAV